MAFTCIRSKSLKVIDQASVDPMYLRPSGGVSLEVALPKNPPRGFWYVPVALTKKRTLRGSTRSTANP
jgi:hypothetical protein